MDKIKKNLPVILLSVCATLLLVIVILLVNNGNTFKLSNNSSKEDTNKESTKEIKKEDTKKTEVEETKEEVNTVTDNENTNSNIPNNDTNTNTNINTNNQEEKSEASLLSYFESEEGLFNSNNKDNETISSKLKNAFTSIIDFIFYDKEIKGYTFKELTSTAKLKVITLALKIDNKIDTYFPNYKETIKDKYTDFKGKLALKYLEVSEQFCNNNPDACSQAKEDFANMKSSFGLTFDLLKELFKNGSTKVKDLYENWRDE